MLLRVLWLGGIVLNLSILKKQNFHYCQERRRMTVTAVADALYRCYCYWRCPLQHRCARQHPGEQSCRESGKTAESLAAADAPLAVVVYTGEKWRAASVAVVAAAAVWPVFAAAAADAAVAPAFVVASS